MDLFKKMKGMKILLIDDDEFIRDSLGLFFEEEGCGVLTLETAEEGLETIRKQIYNIIIADYKLPGMDGLEFFKRIRKPCRNSIKILITAYEKVNRPADITKSGVHEVIFKPFCPKDIEDSLLRLLIIYNTG